MAAAILFAGMLAVMAAIMTGQQNVFEAQFQLQASLLAEEKMKDILQLDYEDIGPLAVPSDEEFEWNGGIVHQNITIIPRQHSFTDIVDVYGGVTSVQGKEITVTISFWREPMTDWRTLTEVKAFVPEPA